MSLLQNSNAVTPVSGYDIRNSCRFNKDDSSYLSRTPSSASNRKTWTMSCWVKLTGHDNALTLMDAGSNPNYCAVNIYQGQLYIYDPSVAPDSIYIKSTDVFRDPAAWYHFVVQLDTTQATNTDRVKLYVNNRRIDSFANSAWPVQNYDSFINNNIEHHINRTGNEYSAPYMAEYHFIDGLAKIPSDFAETDEDTNQWKAIRYAGSYGTNGFKLEFKNSAALGTDTSGEGNTWASTNLAATDQMIDTPQNSTGGNFPTLNPLVAKASYPLSLSEGNLKSINTAGSWAYRTTFGNVGMASGKWYIEVYASRVDYSAGAGQGWVQTGIISYSDTADPDNLVSSYIGTQGAGYGYNSGTGEIYNSGSGAAYGNTYETPDIIGVAIDIDNGKLYFAKNNTWQNSGVPTSGATGTGAISIPTAERNLPYYFALSPANSDQIVNFGQDSSFAGGKTAQGNTDGNDYGDFYYTPPTGYLALCSDNVPTSITLPGEHYNALLYTANNSTLSVTGAGFQPDFCWFKNYGNNNRFAMFDVIRGVGYRLAINGNYVNEFDADMLTSFDSDGWTIGADTGQYGVNYPTASAFVSWNWKAGGAGSANTDGSINSTVSVNTTAGFSIVDFENNNTTGATIGHGLSKAPDMIFMKLYTAAYSWGLYHVGMGEDYYMEPNNDSGIANSAADAWNDTAPTASVFTLGAEGSNALGGEDVIAYCFHDVPGYSRFGRYKGNGNVDGVFVYTDFRPAYIMVKAAGSWANGHWHIFDDKRFPYNQTTNTTYTGITWDNSQNDGGGGGEGCGPIDILSNGFKMRNNNGNGNDPSTYFIFAAFAESPLKTARAR